MKRGVLLAFFIVAQAQTCFAMDAMNAPINMIEGFARECVRYENIDAGTEISFGVTSEHDATFNVGIEWHTMGIFGEVVLARKFCIFSKADGARAAGVGSPGLYGAINVGTFLLDEDQRNQYDIESAIRLLERSGYTVSLD